MQWSSCSLAYKHTSPIFHPPAYSLETLPPPNKTPPSKTLQKAKEKLQTYIENFQVGDKAACTVLYCYNSKCICNISFIGKTCVEGHVAKRLWF